MNTADEGPVRWAISVPKEADVSLRTHLAQTGLRKCDPSKFGADTARRHLRVRNVKPGQTHNIGAASDEIEEIEHAVTAVRARHFARRA